MSEEISLDSSDCKYKNEFQIITLKRIRFLYIF